ncbi:MAG: M48 family metalloprotease, partial [Proteobacteria bacterium]|nr:M48 family metalloprotease [Pseudomonadota bacterium]
FAVPGGYITVNTGLIENTRNEAELASVIAHEIGHQSQRHISRSIERSKQLTLPATAAMIGGLLLGGQAGTAAILSTRAAVASDQLSYSRTFEREADATGMNILAAAGYDPEAMPSFFSQLENQSRLYGGSVLEFLSTHPVNSDRIADGRSRASRLKPAVDIPPTPADRLDYHHAQARTLALYNKPVDAVIKRFEHILDNNLASAREKQIARYGLIIAYFRNEEFKNSVTTLQKLRREAPKNPLYLLAEAELAQASRDFSFAVNLYHQLYQSDPSHPAHIKGYTQALIHNGDNPAAIRILRKTIRHRPEFDWPYGMLARAYAADGKILNAIFIEAQELGNIGLYTRALSLLHQQAKRAYPDSSEYLTASIDGLIKKLEEEKRQLDNFDL